MERLRYSRIMLPDQRKDWMTGDLDWSSVSKATAAEVAMAKSIQARKKKNKGLVLSLAQRLITSTFERKTL